MAQRDRQPLATERLLREVLRDAGLWGFCIVLLALTRAFLLFRFRSLIDPSSGWRDVAAVMLNGIRYDSQTASWVVLPSLLISVACLWRDLERAAGRARLLMGSLFAAVTAVLCVVDLAYFQEYGEQFNHFLFGLYYDDRRAILGTLWKEYHPLRRVFAMGILAAVSMWGLGALLRRAAALSTGLAARLQRWRAILPVTALALPLLFVGGVRGSFGRRPAQLKDAAISRDAFLNRTVINVYSALRYAWSDHWSSTRTTGLQVFLPDGDVRGALRDVTGSPAARDSLDEALARVAAGHAGPRPRHVFLVLMESYEAWPMFEEFAPLGLAPELTRLARNGLSVRPFLPSSSGTIESLSVLVSGLADAGVHTNYQASSRRPYATAVAPAFRRLGYRTRFFYGGYPSWERVADFCREQGFDEVYGGGHMGKWVRGNEWGVDDSQLFGFVMDTVRDDAPSFNLLLTTTFHPPYDIDVRARGFPLTEVPADIAARCKGPPDLNFLGHFWYADRCVGDFVRAAETRLTQPLFALTGDHAGRRTITARPSAAERALVPLVFYGPEVLAGCMLPPQAAGSHLDIVPTLVELCADPGFAYAAMGQNLLSPSARFLGIGRRGVVGDGFLADLASSPPALHSLPWGELPSVPPDLTALRRLQGAVLGVSWWRIMRGPGLTAVPLPRTCLAAGGEGCPR